MILIISTLVITDWIYQGEEDTQGKWKWIGGVRKVEEVKSDFYIPDYYKDWEGDTYENI